MYISLDVGIEGVLLVMELFSLCVCVHVCVHARTCVHAWGVCMGVCMCARMRVHVFTSVYVSYHCYCIHTGEYEVILYIDNVEAQ